MQTILASRSVSVTELKRHYAEVMREADNEPVAVLNHNKPEAYLVPAALYERLINQMEDLIDHQTVEAREAGLYVKVNLDEL